jgi:hypothetical protein
MGIFTDRKQQLEPDAPPSQAEHLNIPAPKITREHQAGLEAAAQISRDQAAQRLAQYEAARDARKAAREATEAIVWARVLERQRNAIG